MKSDTKEKIIGIVLGILGGLALASALEYRYYKKRKYRLYYYEERENIVWFFVIMFCFALFCFFILAWFDKI